MGPVRGATLLLGMLLAAGLGCEDPPPPTPAADEAPSASPPTGEETLDPEAPPPPPPEPADVQAMDEKELEAACFAGNTEACDRLGH